MSNCTIKNILQKQRKHFQIIYKKKNPVLAYYCSYKTIFVVSAPLPFEFGSETPPTPSTPYIGYHSRTCTVCLWWTLQCVDKECVPTVRGLVWVHKNNCYYHIISSAPHPDHFLFNYECQEETVVTQGNTQSRTETPDRDNHPGRYVFVTRPLCSHLLLRWQVVSLCCVGSGSLFQQKHPIRHATRVIPVMS